MSRFGRYARFFSMFLGGTASATAITRPQCLRPAFAAREKNIDDSPDESVSGKSRMTIISGTAGRAVAHETAHILGLRCAPINLTKYQDGEISVQILESLRGQDVYIVGSPNPKTLHDDIMEMLLLASTCRRSSARQITAVLPYLAYSRQDRIRKHRETIAACDMVRLLEAVGVDHVLTIDVHRDQIEGFFESSSTTMDSLDSLRLVVPCLLEKDLYNPIVVCPSETGVSRATALARLLRMEGVAARVAFVASASKKRDEIMFAEPVHHHRLLDAADSYLIMAGSPEKQAPLRNRDVVIVDDMIDSGNRFATAAQKCRAEGAFRVYGFATHGIFSEKAMAKLDPTSSGNNPLFDEIFVTNTVYPPACDFVSDKVTYISVAPILGEAMRRVHHGIDLSSLTHTMG